LKFKEQNPLILAFAIVGICAVLYGGWTLYQQRIEAEQRAILLGPPQIPEVAQSLKSGGKPPPQ
jgi:hypothetical protein